MLEFFRYLLSAELEDRDTMETTGIQRSRYYATFSLTDSPCHTFLAFLRLNSEALMGVAFFTRDPEGAFGDSAVREAQHAINSLAIASEEDDPKLFRRR